jgi:putative membrane protein
MPVRRALHVAAVAALLALQRMPALAHGGAEAGGSPWRWTWEPVTIVALAVSALAYAIGIARVWGQAGRGRGVRRWEAVCFAAGWVALALALLSPLHALGQMLFWLHMAQHEILMLVAAPLLVLGRPVTAWTWSLPRRWRRGVGTRLRPPVVRRTWRIVGSALGAWVLHAIALWFWHIPALFDATLDSELIHALQHLSFFGSALLFWWAMTAAGPNALGTGAAILYVFTTSLHSSLLGVLLTFAPTPWYPRYVHPGPVWGLTPLEDQQLGGLVMWIPAGVVYVIAGLALMAVWLRDPAARRAELRSAADTPARALPYTAAEVRR